MNITITARKFRAKDSLKDFISSKLTSLEKYNNDIMDANVILSYIHNKDSIKSAEVILQVPGKVISATEESEEFTKSIDLVMDKLSRQLKKYKTKRLAHVK